MILRKTADKPQRLLQVGLVFLLLASLANYFLPRVASVPESVADGGMGLLYGIAIALLLLALRTGRSRG